MKISSTLPQSHVVDQFVIATACDKKYAKTALNLIGSLNKNYSSNDYQIIVYDLGISRLQKYFFKNIPQVSLVKVPPFSKYWQQCWGWKAWIFDKVEGREFLYLDSGMEVLRNLNPIRKIINRDGYFFVTQSSGDNQLNLATITPSDYFKRFDHDRKTFASKDIIAAGILGFDKNSAIYKSVAPLLYKAIAGGYHTGWSATEANRNNGIHFMTNPPLRDCPLFRHDQTLLNIFAYKFSANLKLQDLARFAGYKSPHDHPQQLIWHHRRVSNLPYIGLVPYSKHRLLHKMLNRLYPNTKF